MKEWEARCGYGATMAEPGTSRFDHMDFDPADVPVRDAATVLILRPADTAVPDGGIEVLMLKRNARSVFVPDMWVFPGGAVDPEDASPEADARVQNRTDAQSSADLGIERGGIAFWVAALRETFEEAGVLLGRRSGEEHLVDLSHPDTEARFSRYRDALNDRSVDADFVDIIEAEDVHLDGSGVHYISRWITPFGSPRRYDTRFFVTAMPQGQVPLHDNEEAVEHMWVRPEVAVAANETDEMLMLAPTLSVLKRLATHATVTDALAAAQRATDDDEQVVKITPGVDDHQRIVFPGDPGYDDADDKIELGWLRWPAG